MVTAAPVLSAGWLPAWLRNVTITGQPVSAQLEGATAAGVLWRAAPGKFLLDVPGVGRFLVSTAAIAHANEVAVDAEPGVEPARVARFFRMAPFAALLYQRGILACHAAVVCAPESWPGTLGGGAVVIAGASAMGKSSVAAALVDRGFQLLSDDLAAIDLDSESRPVALATETAIGLWPDAVERLFPDGIPDSGKPAVRGIRYLQVDAPKRDASVPLVAIYHLEVAGTSSAPRGEYSSISRFELVSRLCYNSQVAEVLLNRPRFLQLAGAITRQVRFERLRRMDGRWQAGEMADRILESLG